jgi:AbrB family looped-hinge helix DNA binding protein
MLDHMMTMKVTMSGQISVPAEVRRRWGVSRVQVIDEGDRLIVRPVPDDPIGELRGRFAGAGPTVDEMRREARAEEAAAERRRDRS